MAARYNLQALYPNQPSLWGSYDQKKTDKLRDEHSDLYARPKFANLLNAQAIISLHTNADKQNGTGMRAVYQTGRMEDKKLGDTILCHAQEIINAQEHYKNYSVQKSSDVYDKAENQAAINRSAIIVETGFHTNPTDAQALQDPLFVTAAMKGIEKGYRLYREGKTDCTPYQISNATHPTIAWGVKGVIHLSYRGYPQSLEGYPVQAVTLQMRCISGALCQIGAMTVTNLTDPHITLACPPYDPTSPAPRTTTIGYSLIDADQVKTPEIQQFFTCGSSAVTPSHLATSAQRSQRQPQPFVLNGALAE